MVTLISGGRIDLSNFRSGWVKLPFGPSTAHYVRRADTGMHAVCGYRPRWRKDAGGFIALEPGNYPKCKRCSGWLSNI